MTKSELIELFALLTTINNTPASLSFILNIGTVEDIKGDTHVSAVSNADNLQAHVKIVYTLPEK